MNTLVQVGDTFTTRFLTKVQVTKIDRGYVTLTRADGSAIAFAQEMVDSLIATGALTR